MCSVVTEYGFHIRGRSVHEVAAGAAVDVNIDEAWRDVEPSGVDHPLVPIPQIVPDVLKNPKCSAFFRNNLGLAYARALSIRRGHDEALLVLKAIPVEQVAVPATYLFTRAVCEHATLQRTEATRSIVRLLEDGAGAPERYRTVSALMLLDMQTWKEKDLGSVARK